VDESPKHLSIEQIEWLIDTEPFLTGHARDPNRFDEARRHLGVCEACQKLVSAQRDLEVGLRTPKHPGGVTRSQDCPSERTLLELAGGILTTETAERLLDHITGCDHCGPAFERVAGIFAPQGGPEEERVLRNLESASGIWQKRLAGRLKASPQQPPRVTFRWLAFATVAAIALVLSFALFHRKTPNDRLQAERLLAEVYGEGRSMDVRMIDAPYSATATGTRGDESKQSVFTRPVKLRKAEDLISDNIELHPDAPVWQELQARADIVEGRFYPAIKTLEALRETNPEDDSVKLDLAVAYFQRAQAATKSNDSNNADLDYGRGVDLLGQVLSKHPDNAVALFNRALMLEKLQLFSEAAKDWDHYLRIDSNSAWAREARDHLSSLNVPIGSQKNRSTMPLLSPSEFASRMEQVDPTTISELDGRVEQYLDVVLREWLAQAFPESDTNLKGSADYLTGVVAVSQLLEMRHDDRWLAELLQFYRHSPTAAKTASLLSQSYNANLNGDFSNALILANSAENSAAMYGDRAGLKEAEWLILYSTRLSLQGTECLPLGQQLSNSLNSTSYQWLKARTLLDYAQCADTRGDFVVSKQLNDAASLLSQRFQYPDLALRTQKFDADLALEMNSPSSSIALAEDGLTKFWANSSTAMSGYNLYTTIDDVAESQQLWRLDAKVISEGLHLIPTDPDYGMRAVEQQRLANALLMSGDLEGARANLESAHELLSRSAPGQATLNKLAEIEVGIAKVELLQGKPVEAASRLQQIQTQILKAGNDYLSLEFDVAYGESLRLTGYGLEAEKEFSDAIEITEIGLREVKDERERLQWIRHNSAAYREVVRTRLDRDPSSAFGLWEAYKGASLQRSLHFNDGTFGIHAGQLRIAPTSFTSRTRGLIDNETAILSYAFFADGLSIWIIGSDGVKQRWVKNTGRTIESESRRFVSECADPLSDVESTRRSGRELYSLLVRPVEDLLSNRTKLIIEPDGALERIPFSALIDGSGAYLGDRFEISVSPGLNYLMNAAMPAHFSSNSHALIVANSLSYPSLHLPALHAADSEARNIAAMFDDSIVYLESTVTVSLITRELSSADLFHFAGHSVVVGGTAGLVVNDEVEVGEAALFSAYSLLQHPSRRLRLVVLASCESAEGVEGSFTDVGSLARSFISSGVSQVVASQWEVDSNSTEQLMKRFYVNLVGHRSVSESLRRAQNELRADPKLQHPYYWAAFSVFGRV
jgi:CHAT domain-containing protein